MVEKLKPPTVTEITAVLCRTRHSKDVCIPECKDGPSQGVRSRRMDLWTMRKSYSQFCMTGYEIKVTRRDYIQDEKWKDYLPLCHELYFVCPWGVIQPEEVPASCGLIWMSRNLTKGYVKKKADFRKIEPPVDLLVYVIMSRLPEGAALKGGPIERDLKADKVEMLKRWVDEGKELKDLGYRVAHKIRQEVDWIKKENDRLRIENEGLQQVKEFWTNVLKCHPADLKPSYYRTVKDTCEKNYDKIKHAGIKELDEALQTMKSGLKTVEGINNRIDEVRKVLTSLSLAD
jgi:hypothetical protein